MSKGHTDPFSLKDPWRPYEGNGYAVNEVEFKATYGMTPWEYMEACDRRGVPCVRGVEE